MYWSKKLRLWTSRRAAHTTLPVASRHIERSWHAQATIKGRAAGRTGEEGRVNATTKAFIETCKKCYDYQICERSIHVVLALILTSHHSRSCTVNNGGTLSREIKGGRLCSQPSVADRLRQPGRDQKVHLGPQHTVMAYLPANLRWLGWKASRGWARCAPNKTSWWSYFFWAIYCVRCSFRRSTAYLPNILTEQYECKLR